MIKNVGIWIAGIGLVAAAAWGQSDGVAGGLLKIRLNTGRIMELPFEQTPLSFRTPAGSLSFLPSELESIVFSGAGECEVTTVYHDRWASKGGPESLRRLVPDPQIAYIWTYVKSVSFPPSTTAVAQAAIPWQIELNDGSRVNLAPGESAVRLAVPSGKFDVPLGVVEHLQFQTTDDGLEAMAEIAPGGYAIRGMVASDAVQGRDLGGRRIVLPWDAMARFTRSTKKATPESDAEFTQEVVCRFVNGQETRLRIPVMILTVAGRGGTWSVPTTRILQMVANPDGTHSIQTTVGEWLTGKISPDVLPVATPGAEANLPLAQCSAMQWPNESVEMPTHCLAWRLKSGDLLAGEWQTDPEAENESSSTSLRMRSPVASASGLLPMQIDGKWPVARFDVAHWTDGVVLHLPASAVETVRSGSLGQMPPAIAPAGPSGVWSDEILMPGGSFRLGRARGEGPADETPSIELSLEPFWLANTPVTVDQFAAFVHDTGHVTDAERSPASATWRAPGFVQRSDDPVVCVAWRDAVRYCNWLSAQAGLKPCYDIRRAGQEIVFYPERNGYRLPIEAEREYAARSGGLDVTYPWGEEDAEKTVAEWANFRLSDSAADPWPWTNPVKAYPPSKAGFYGMAGNVWEWCQDVYREDAYANLLRGEGMGTLLNAAPGRDERRVMRGGSYNNSLDLLRCAARGHGIERMGAPRVGFRVARNAETAAR